MEDSAMRLCVIIALLISVSAFADAEPSACDTSVDLREEGQSLSGLENIAQGYNKNFLCGFFTFSQYLDAWRVAHGRDRGEDMARSSAIVIGVDHAIHKDLPYWFPYQFSSDPLSLRLGRWGTTFCSLAEAVRDEGYCADPDLPTRMQEPPAKFADATKAVYEGLSAIAAASPRNRKTSIDKNFPAIYATYLEWGEDRGRQVLSQEQVLAWIMKDPTKPYRTIREMFFPSCAKSTSRRNDFSFKSCGGEFYVGLDSTGIPSPNQDPLRTDRAARRIRELLEKPNATPVPFAYCSSVLSRGKGYDGAFPVGHKCGLHWSLIAGRKKIGGECYLLVRNSWTNNSHYSKDWIVEGGDLWVREKELTRAMILVQWLKD